MPLVFYFACEITQDGAHDPVKDAQYAMRLFNTYRHLHNPEKAAQLAAVRQSLLSSPRTQSFAELNPFVDGVAMRHDPICVNCRDAPTAHV